MAYLKNFASLTLLLAVPTLTSTSATSQNLVLNPSFVDAGAGGEIERWEENAAHAQSKTVTALEYNGANSPGGLLQTAVPSRQQQAPPSSPTNASALPPSASFAASFNGFPWSRVPLKASPGIGNPEVAEHNRTSGVLTDGEVAWLANNHDLIIVSGATQDPGNTSACGEARVGDVARRIKQVNSQARVFVYFPSSRDESAQQHYCGEDIFDLHPDWRVKTKNGSDFIVNGAYQHDLSQAAVREWWVAAATNSSFFGEHFDGVFADNAIATADQLVEADGTHLAPTVGQALLKGQQMLYAELGARFKQLASHDGRTRSMIFNGIRQGQKFAAIPELLPYADGGEMEGWLVGDRQRFPGNGSLNPALVIPTIQTMINASRINPAKQVLLKTVPGGGFDPRPSQHWSPAQYRAAALASYKFPLAAYVFFPSFFFFLPF